MRLLLELQHQMSELRKKNEEEMNALKEENALMKKKLEEVSKGHERQNGILTT